MKRMKISGNQASGAGIIILLAALVLYLYNLWDTERAQNISESTVIQLEEFRKDSTQEIIFGEEEGTAAEVLINGTAYIGSIRIPSLGLELPVAAEWSEDSMKDSPCRYIGSADENDLVIVGYNYSRHFGQLEDLVNGYTLEYVDMQGKTIEYQIGKTEVHKEEQLQNLQQSEWDLILVSYTSAGRVECTVRCKRTEE